jgi:hypothetical protein
MYVGTEGSIVEWDLGKVLSESRKFAGAGYGYGGGAPRMMLFDPPGEWA